jgi:hypothetical protein
MPPLSLSQLYQSYMQLRGQLENQTLSYQQFVDSVRQLQAQDATGQWWTIDPQTGKYLTYTSGGWVEAMPTVIQPAAQPTQASAQPVVTTPQPATVAQHTQLQPVTLSQADTASPITPKGRMGCLASSMLTSVLSIGTALLWYAYTSLSPSSEGNDLTTPLLIAGTPLLMQVLRKPLDKLMNPLYKLLNLLPRPLLVGAAFAVPLVLGGILTKSYGSGYGALRRSIVVSVVSGYILTRRPEVRL